MSFSNKIIVELFFVLQIFALDLSPQQLQSAVVLTVSDAAGEWLPRRAADLQEALNAEKNRKGLFSYLLLFLEPCCEELELSAYIRRRLITRD